MALLRLLLELRNEIGFVLSVVHFNHKLRGKESQADQEFVANLAWEYGLEFFVDAGDAARHAQQERRGVEAAARELRYGFFHRLLGASAARATDHAGSDRSAGIAATSEIIEGAALNKVATGHTLDDQAETVLMRVIRGTGFRGLGGIYPRILVERGSGEKHGEIIRPLLGIRRCELETYMKSRKQPWREDATNSETSFVRNRVRKLVLPLLEREFNPAISENLSELAEIARDEEEYWENEISGWLGTVVQWSHPEGRTATLRETESLVQIQLPKPESNLRRQFSGVIPQPHEPEHEVFGNLVSRLWLVTEPRAVQRRVLKAIAEQAGLSLEFKHIEEILRFAEEESTEGKTLSLPLGWKMVREREAVEFVAPDTGSDEPLDYEYSLPVPGRLFVPELGKLIEVILITQESGDAEYNPQQLLRVKQLPKELTLRNWRAGDRFWPVHTKSPKKVKELLQGKSVRDRERKLWPVALSGDEIVWMRGFPAPAKIAAGPGEEAVTIREVEDDSST